MFKKKVGSFIVVSALCAGLGLGVAADKAEAASWNNSSISQNQAGSGWSSFYKNQTSQNNQTQNSVSGVKGAGVGQTSFVSGNQVQAGTSTGAATASQTQDTTVDVGDNLNGNPQTTTGTGSLVQDTTTTGPTKLVQKQSSINATFHFQGSIEGGPSLQQQINQNHSFQFSTAVSK